MGNDYYLENHFSAAADEYEKALRIDPGFAAAHQGLGAARIALRELDAAAVSFKKAIQLAPDLYPAHFSLGTIYYYREMYGEAAAEFKECLRIDEGNPQALFYLGSVYLAQKDLEEALLYFLRSKDSEPDNAETLKKIGIVYGLMGDPVLGISFMRQAVAINPDDDRAKGILDNMIRLQKEVDSESEIRGALLVDPSNADLHRRLGKLLVDDDRPEEALPILMKALALAPSDREVITLTAGVLQLLDRDEEAIRLLKDKILADPGYKEFHHVLACVYAAIHRMDEAVPEFMKALEIDPGDVGVRCDLAVAFLYDARLGEAETEFMKVLAADPANKEARESLVTIAMLRAITADGKRDSASQKPKSARKLQPGLRAKADELIAMTDTFCDRYLDAENKGLCEKLIEKMARKKDVPFMRGRIEIWAAAVVYALAQINFLFDKDSQPRTNPDEICGHFKVNKATVSYKAAQIRAMFGMGQYDEEFSTVRVLKDSPYRKYVKIDGVAVDLSRLPPRIRELIFKGNKD